MSIMFHALLIIVIFNIKTVTSTNAYDAQFSTFYSYSCDDPSISFINITGYSTKCESCRGVPPCSWQCGGNDSCLGVVYLTSKTTCVSLENSTSSSSSEQNPLNITNINPDIDSHSTNCTVYLKTAIPPEYGQTLIQPREFYPKSWVKLTQDNWTKYRSTFALDILEANVLWIFKGRTSLSSSLASNSESKMILMTSDSTAVLESTFASSDQGVFRDTPKDFLKSGIFQLYLFPPVENIIRRSRVTNVGEVTPPHDDYLVDQVVLIPTLRPTDELVYDSVKKIGNIDGIIRAVRLGYRRVSQLSTWIEIEETQSSSDVKFHAINAFVGPDKTDDDYPMPPFYFTSFVLSAKTGNRESFKRKIGENSEVIYDSVKSISPWVFDTTWTLLSTSKDTPDHTYAVIKETLLAGNDVRVVINETSSTDVTHITLKDGDIFMQLSSRLSQPDQIDTPNIMKTIDSAMSLSGRYYECESEYDIRKTYRTAIENLGVSKIEYFTSTKKLTRLFVQEKSDEVPKESIEALNRTISMGQSIRVCFQLRKYPDGIECFTSTFVRVSENGVFAKSAQSLLPEKLLETGIKNEMSAQPCAKTVYVLSTDGAVRELIHAEGRELAKFRNAWTKKQYWFALG